MEILSVIFLFMALVCGAAQLGGVAILLVIILFVAFCAGMCA